MLWDYKEMMNESDNGWYNGMMKKMMGWVEIKKKKNKNSILFQKGNKINRN